MLKAQPGSKLNVKSNLITPEEVARLAKLGATIEHNGDDITIQNKNDVPFDVSVRQSTRPSLR